MTELISPLPPVADTRLPWDEEMADPIAAIGAARAEHGDTFVIEGARSPFLFLFSPVGVQSFYAVEEADASKGIADWQMLRRKLPPELFRDRRTFPHDLFTRDDVVQYLDVARSAIDIACTEIGDAGTFEVFDFTRRLGHRIGLSTWAGPCGTSGEFDALIGALDDLDGAAAFVDPGAMSAVAASDYATERAALATAEAIIGQAIDDRDADPDPPDDHFQRIADTWYDTPPDSRRTGIARDIILVHLGSMSNLFSALGWLLVDVSTRPDLATAIRDGDHALAERCALESTRIAQRSIMLRAVLRPIHIDDGTRTWSLEPGVTLATLLPLTNLATEDLRAYDPERWNRRRLRDGRGGGDHRELVTAFGHGAHTCPAQPFSLSIMTVVLEAMLDRYELLPQFTDASPRLAQIGGVARASRACPIKFSVRTSNQAGTQLP
jgi:cytochrome P450